MSFAFIDVYLRFEMFVIFYNVIEKCKLASKTQDETTSNYYTARTQLLKKDIIWDSCNSRLLLFILQCPKQRIYHIDKVCISANCKIKAKISLCSMLFSTLTIMMFGLPFYKLYCLSGKCFSTFVM